MILLTIEINQIIPYGLGILTGLLITAWFFRLVFDVAQRTRHIKAQTDLLAKVAEKAGVPHDDVFKIVNAAKKPG